MVFKNKEIDRRTFLKRSGAVVLSTVLSSCGLIERINTNLDSRVYASETLRNLGKIRAVFMAENRQSIDFHRYVVFLLRREIVLKAKEKGFDDIKAVSFGEKFAESVYRNTEPTDYGVLFKDANAIRSYSRGLAKELLWIEKEMEKERSKK